MERAKEKFTKQKKRDKLKRKLIKQNPDKIKYFIVFTYKDKITEKNVTKILKKRGIIR